ncbi:hypothetical protein ACFE04_011310 [Oxalis oulophora]
MMVEKLMSFLLKDPIHHGFFIAKELLMKGFRPRDSPLLVREVDDVFLVEYVKIHCQAIISKQESQIIKLGESMKKTMVERGLALNHQTCRSRWPAIITKKGFYDERCLFLFIDDELVMIAGDGVQLV